MFKLNPFFLDADLSIRPELQKALQEILDTHATKAAHDLGIDWPINFTIYPNPAFAMKETGEGGYTPSKDWVQLSVDLTSAHIAPAQVITNLAPTIYHEMNHCKRWSTVGYGSTLEEAIVTEGLASVFEEDIWTESKAPWLVYTDDELEQCIQLVKDHGGRTPYVHSDWFFCTNPAIPRWLGYKVGHAIVRRTLSGHPEISLLELMGTSGSDILTKAGVTF